MTRKLIKSTKDKDGNLALGDWERGAVSMLLSRLQAMPEVQIFLLISYEPAQEGFFCHFFSSGQHLLPVSCGFLYLVVPSQLYR